MEKAGYYKNLFRDTLLNNFAPFWTEASPDAGYGGYLCGFDREGKLFYEDKSVWQQGRSLWMFSKLYNEFGGEEKWLRAAKSGYDFINAHCFAPDGHMYFRVTRDGRPLVLRRYYYSEAFAVMGYVEFYKATGDEAVRRRAEELFCRMRTYYETPGYFPPKVDPKTRATKGHGVVMILLNVAQTLREIAPAGAYDAFIDGCIATLQRDFIRPDEGVLLETVAADGSRLDSPEGRLVNPGHSLETAWFLMREAIYRRDDALMRTAMEVTRWALRRGWDETYGGLFYFVDALDKPVLSLEWDMKLLWPHCEAMIALLLAHRYSGDALWAAWFEKICAYVFRHFPDDPYPEWPGHLHRDGTPINYIKGSDWKGPYHNVRAFMLLTQLFEEAERNVPLYETKVFGGKTK